MGRTVPPLEAALLELRTPWPRSLSLWTFPARPTSAPPWPRCPGNSTTTSSRGSPRSMLRCLPSSAARPAPASPRWSTPSSVGWCPRPASSGRPPGRPCWCTTPPTRTGSPAPGSCLGCPERRARSSTISAADARSLRLVPDESLPAGLALLDAPDIDSVVAENRQLAAQLLAAADLWLFVTSAARYADAVPWDFLISAAERSAAVAVVLDRVPPRAMQDVPPHLGQLMIDRGLGSSPLFAVPETSVTADGLLPDAAVQPIRTWLAHWPPTRPAEPRWSGRRWTGPSRPSSVGCPTGPRRWTGNIVLDQLRAEVDHSYAEAVRTVQVQTEDGTLLRGEVLARWHEFVGTGEFFRALEQRVGWLRDKIVSVFKGEPPGAGNLKVAVESGLEALLRAESDAAAERAEASWQAHVAGRQILAGTGSDLSRSSAGLRRRGLADRTGLAGRRPGPRGRRGDGQALQGPVPGSRGERGRGGADDRRLRPHRRARREPRSGWRAGQRCWPSASWRRCSATRPSAGWRRRPRRISTLGSRP